jgi:predicted nucleotidyltransferase
MESGRTAKLMEANIIAICENEPLIVAAFLFGSYAKGKDKPSSDIDVALLLSEKKAIEFSRLQFAAKLEKKLRAMVDVVILNNAGEVLKFQVRRDGKLIFERSSKQRKQFEVKSRKLYEDFLYLHRNYAKKVLYGGKNGRSRPA